MSSGKTLASRAGIKDMLEEFKDFCLINLDFSESNYRRHKVCIKDFLEFFICNISRLSRRDLRKCLKSRIGNEAKSTYANRIKALRRFFRDFLKTDQLIGGFKFSRLSVNNKSNIPKKGDLQESYSHIEGKRYRPAFLFLASSGMRTSEVTSPKISNMDFNIRMVAPGNDSSTKRSSFTFYNSET